MDMQIDLILLDLDSLPYMPSGGQPGLQNHHHVVVRTAAPVPGEQREEVEDIFVN